MKSIVLATALTSAPLKAEELNTRDRVMKKIDGVLAFDIYIYFFNSAETVFLFFISQFLADTDYAMLAE